MSHYVINKIILETDENIYVINTKYKIKLIINSNTTRLIIINKI